MIPQFLDHHPMNRSSPGKRKLEPSPNSDDDHHHLPMRPRKLDSKPDELVFPSSDGEIQFFVRMFSGGKTLVMRAGKTDTIERVHNMIERATRIPVIEQRLIYGGRQLNWDQTLAECGIKKDAEFHLVARMRSTKYPTAWQVSLDIVRYISALMRECFRDGFAMRRGFGVELIRNRVEKYLLGIKEVERRGKEMEGDVVEYLRVFVDSSAHKALVMLYMLSGGGYKDCGCQCIQLVIARVMEFEDRKFKSYGARIVVEFCRLLRDAGEDDMLYLYCRSSLGSIVRDVGVMEHGFSFKIKVDSDCPHFVGMIDILPFFVDVAARLMKDMVLCMEQNSGVGSLVREVADFAAYLHPLRTLVSTWLPLSKMENCPFGRETELLRSTYFNLMRMMDHCLEKLEANLAEKGKDNGGTCVLGWSSFLCILKELNGIAELFRDEGLLFKAMMSKRRVSVEGLIVRYTKHGDDYQWLFGHKDVLGFVSRRHLALLMFPDKQDWDEMHEMLIDRDQLLAESFEYISQATGDSLRAGLFMEFKNEEATGPGVLREWFFLVCQEIFNPQNALFTTCPHDRRRFFPNPASKVDPMHLKYFKFSGRVVALALMHKVQVGIVLDRVFFLQLAEEEVSLEDIKDADPYMYNSCKQILEMDAESVDSDALGLTFVWEVEELGSRKDVELCAHGKHIVVNSNNREEYVMLLVKYRFGTSIADQVSEFGKGFSDVVGGSENRKTFFRSLELQDFDLMLHGSGSAISIEDWKEHTKYQGYKKSDPQICWFWEIVGRMPAEQKNVLLFFWTSIKYLPVDGFGGLASRLHIYRSFEPIDRLPSSHTCFYRLCIPPYRSFEVMQKALDVITQEHVGCSFGTW